MIGAVGHDFYSGQRDGAKGFPRFTDPRLRGEADYADYLRMATERSLERCGLDSFDLLLRSSPERQQAELNYVRDLNFNTVRLEGKLENEHFFDLADQMGILVMPGWCSPSSACS